MKFSLTALTLVLSVIISACSSPQPMWRKAGISQFDINNTLAKCRYDIGMAKVDQRERTLLISDCMNSQGYRYN